MTAIAYKGGVLACDMGASSGAQLHLTHKLCSGIHPKLGAMALAFTGSCFLMEAMKSAIFCGESMPDISKHHNTTADETLAMILTHDGKLFELSTTGIMLPNYSPCVGLGSGAEFVEGAMYAGASAKDAIELAIKHTPCAHLGVVTATVDELMLMQIKHEQSKPIDWAGYKPPATMCSVSAGGLPVWYDPDIAGARELANRMLDDGIRPDDITPNQLAMIRSGAVRPERTPKVSLGNNR
jgi:hypothetical protein